jgi:hypothetical protein
MTTRKISRHFRKALVVGEEVGPSAFLNAFGSVLIVRVAHANSGIPVIEKSVYREFELGAERAYPKDGFVSVAVSLSTRNNPSRVSLLRFRIKFSISSAGEV